MINQHQYFVYLLTNKSNSVIYIGVTNDLERRVWQHKQAEQPGFTKRYACNKLVYFEKHQWIQDAIDREKLLKGGSRQAKVDLVNQENNQWKDLSDGWYDDYVG